MRDSQKPALSWKILRLVLTGKGGIKEQHAHILQETEVKHVPNAVFQNVNTMKLRDVLVKRETIELVDKNPITPRNASTLRHNIFITRYNNK